MAYQPVLPDLQLEELRTHPNSGRLYVATNMIPVTVRISNIGARATQPTARGKARSASVPDNHLLRAQTPTGVWNVVDTVYGSVSKRTLRTDATPLPEPAAWFRVRAAP